MGGVLIENPWIRTAKKIGREPGTDEGAVLDELTRLAVALDRGADTLRGLHEKLVASLGVVIPYDDFASLVLDKNLRKIMPTWRAVSKIKRAGRLRVVALSNMSEEVWASVGKKHRISSLFHSEVMSFDLGVTKPDPGIFMAALEQTGAAPEESLFVDDTLANIRAATSMGFRTYHVTDSADAARFLTALVASPGKTSH